MARTFTDAEIGYLDSQPLGRLATADRDKRFRDTEGGEAVGERVGASFKFEPAWIRIRPRRILSWGIDNGSFEMLPRDVG
jgi:hypothetical protein